MNCNITISKDVNEPARINLNGELHIMGEWRREVEWLSDMVKAIGTKDEQSRNDK